jgi:hypothetical protein
MLRRRNILPSARLTGLPTWRRFLSSARAGLRALGPTVGRLRSCLTGARALFGAVAVPVGVALWLMGGTWLQAVIPALLTGAVATIIYYAPEP